ncbi:hypothetical protein IAT38_008155 [Cryptococcus sp. DSM 104549]
MSEYLPPPITPTKPRFGSPSAAYSAAENGGQIPSTSASYSPNQQLTQRAPSPTPSPTRAAFFDQSPGGGGGSSGMERSGSRGLSGPGLSGGSGGGAGGGGGGGWESLTPQRIGRAIGARFMRAVRRGNLPFLIVFFSCTIVFFSALAGIGYVEPPLDPNAPAPPGGPGAAGQQAEGFKLGGPIFDSANDRLGLERKMAEQRALEESWARKRRPMDGAWMRKQRDDKAVRRVPPAQTKSTNAQALQTKLAEMVVDTGDSGSDGLAKRDDAGAGVAAAQV